MKSSMCNLFFGTLFIWSYLRYASSIECYNCHSLEDEQCLEDYVGFKRKCPSSDSVCSITSDSKDIIERKCGTEPYMEDGKDQGNDNSGPRPIYWNTCKTDLCNWGVMNKSQILTLVVSATLCVSFYYTF